MNRLEDARAFAGADWQKLSLKSRRELLKRNHQFEGFDTHTWWQLPPSVKQALINPLLKKPEVVRG